MQPRVTVEESVKMNRNCQHKGGEELGINSMVNISELFINTVSQKEPNYADRL
jgi:hypothetical protein